jgi:hypothetical protein
MMLTPQCHSALKTGYILILLADQKNRTPHLFRNTSGSKSTEHAFLLLWAGNPRIDRLSKTASRWRGRSHTTRIPERHDRHCAATGTSANRTRATTAVQRHGQGDAAAEYTGERESNNRITVTVVHLATIKYCIRCIGFNSVAPSGARNSRIAPCCSVGSM